MDTADFLIIGGGVIGLAIANEIKYRYSDAKIILIEKEKEISLHASGRNSGVLHAGFYYTADSLKAKFTKDGNKKLREYCAKKKLRINQCGKLVVAQNEKQLDALKLLYDRGLRNGVELEYITADDAKEIEPGVYSYESALWSPTTASVDPREVVFSFEQDALHAGIQIKKNTTYHGVNIKNNTITTNNGEITAGYIINTAGLYADRIARDFGFSKNYRIIPFKGLYLYTDLSVYKPKTNIYPVPDLNHPFLGVHFTMTVDGDAKLGPTAIPAFWREHYSGFERFNISEAAEILYREADLFIRNSFGFRSLAFEEIKKYNKNYMLSEAKKLLDKKDIVATKWGAPGIRAQLLDIKNKKLEMDFIYEGDSKSFHVLNAVSPAFTCSLSFSEYLVDQVVKLTN